MIWIPRVSDELPRLVRDDVLRYEEARVEALDVFKRLRWIVGDGRLRDGGIRDEEARYRSVEDVAVEIVGG
jgi:hypothetical protein